MTADPLAWFDPPICCGCYVDHGTAHHDKPPGWMRSGWCGTAPSAGCTRRARTRRRVRGRGSCWGSGTTGRLRGKWDERQRRRYVESWHSFGNRDGKVWHGPCMAFERWRTTADERLAVLDLICDVWGVTQSDVEQVVALRTADDATGGNERNRAWRVMYALQNHRVAARSAGEQRG
jgi:hypothetical protein